MRIKKPTCLIDMWVFVRKFENQILRFKWFIYLLLFNKLIRMICSISCIVENCTL